MAKAVLFQTIQFCISTVQRSNTSIQAIDRNYLVLPLWAIENLGAKTMKGYSTFPRAQTLLETHNFIV